jgi:saccharopine dehydrogenase-like NADP-dependent oxidoreductase
MVKKRIFIAGAGHIGPTIAHILAQEPKYEIIVADLSALPVKSSHFQHIQLDLSNEKELHAYLGAYPVDAVVCCLPHYLTVKLTDAALKFNTHYFDLTEDVQAGAHVEQVAQTSAKAFVPHCGLAPGFIDIVAHDLITSFDSVDECKLRCGALPQSSSNALQYARTWSTDGLINEYLNPCLQLIDSKIAYGAGLDDLEEIQIDGASYEAFNTSGGTGTLINTHENKVKTLNYKTIRYPGHGDKMRFLARGLKLDHDRPTLKRIIENATPMTNDDVVIVYVATVGSIKGVVHRKAFVRKYYPTQINGQTFTAIQTTTASGASAVIDLVLSKGSAYKGFIRQENFTLDQILNNRFGRLLK